ncbi:MAG: hypothetical protein LBS31_10845 [Candidatus Adiutrix sp.]|jgi:ferredoxin|nr:hypothetical protein [Candidatus Adiutrix sp.]
MSETERGDFTRDFIEAGRRLTERGLLRSRFILGTAPAPSPGPFSRLAASDGLLGEILGDPDKAEAFLRNGDGRGQDRPPLWPWAFRWPAPGPAAPPFAELADAAERAALADFQGLTAAFLAGAALAGVAKLNENFIYSKTLDGRAIEITAADRFESDETAVRLPLKADRVLILGFIRAPGLMGLNPALARLRPLQGWLDWTGQIQAVQRLAAFIAAGGSLAFPSAGGLIMADVHGALAGLGELGRQGLMISPEYGPNLRLFSIITDYPFEMNAQALNFGIADYCDSCRRCLNECPAKAVSEGQRRLTEMGLRQWPLDREACFKNWLEKKDPCLKCIEACPYAREPLVGSAGGRPPA